MNFKFIKFICRIKKWLKAVNLDFTMVDQLLQRNPHLKKIEIYYIKLNHGDVIQAIAKYHPLIEQICLQVPNEADAEYLGKLRIPESVKFGSALRNLLIAMKAPLEHLKLLQYLDRTFVCTRLYEREINQLVERIAKLKNLKTILLFKICRLDHPIEVCKNLAELNHFELHFLG